MIPTTVKLIGVTPNAEENILYIARVSSDQENKDAGLLKYLIRHKHWSPFQHAYMTLEFRTSRAISVQMIRHLSFTYQEFSQRYAEAPQAIIYLGRKKGSTNRQSSIDDLEQEIQTEWIRRQQRVYDFVWENYKWALDHGIAKECARFILPGATETLLYMTGSVRSWIHYLEQRCDEHTQFEHRELAIAAKAIFIEQFPVVAEALGWAGGDAE